MLYKILDKKNFNGFLNNLISNYDFIGPKKIDKAVHDFESIKNIEEIDLNYIRTTLPPAKKILFPSIEKLVGYSVGEKIKVKPLVESSEKILFGISSWDINGINFMDRIFREEYIDENYVSKRNRLIVVGMDCEPSDTNFSAAVGAEYAKEGFDLFLSDLGDRYFIRIATIKGNSLVGKFAETKEAVSKDFNDYDKYMDEYRKKFKKDIEISNFYDNFEHVYDDEEFWEKISKDCYSCGSCNLVCPTCFCFNVKDDMELNLMDGIKSREWDSCMIPDYGLVAGGHNFRTTRANRLKQRYRCKLKTFVDKYGKYACIGCGRCVDTCLAKINIYEDINSIKKEVSI
jgi:sulfhydrogenase subunit beta (sulfur reductase)